MGSSVGGPLAGHAGAGAAREAEGAGAGVAQRGVEHVPQLGLVGGGHHHQVGDAAQVGEVERALVRLAVGAHQPAAVEREGDRQLLQRHVVDDLVVGPLQEGRVDGHHRPHPLAGQAGREGHGVLLGDADVVGPVREGRLALDQAGPLQHGGGDGHHLVVGLHLLDERLGEEVGVGLGGRLLHRLAGGHVEEGEAVAARGRVRLGRVVALALLGDDVEEDRIAEPGQLLEGLHQRRHVVAVGRADVVEAQPLEHHPRRHQRLGGDDAVADGVDGLVPLGQLLEELLHALAPAVVGARRELLGEPLAHGADVGRDRHLVVVEHHDQVALQVAGLVEPLEGLAAGHGAVAEHGHHLARLAAQVLGLDHAERRRDGGGGVAHAEGVVLRLVPLGEAGQPPLGADGAEPVAPAGQQLVGVGLVADVPDQLVGGRREDVVERDVELHRPQGGAEVAAVGGAGLDDLLADLGAEPGQVADGELLQVCGRVDRVEQAAHDRLLLHFLRSMT